MHKYLRAIGFGKLTDRKELQKLLTDIVVNGTDRAYTSNSENTLLAEVFDECRDSFRIHSKTGYKKTAVKCSMFYNSLFQSVFDFWIKLSKKNCSKIEEEGQ